MRALKQLTRTRVKANRGKIGYSEKIFWVRDVTAIDQRGAVREVIRLAFVSREAPTVNSRGGWPLVVPEGHDDSSPAFQRWVQGVRRVESPVGTVETQSSLRDYQLVFGV